MATVYDMIRAMSTVAPPEMAEPWDNCGLQVGRYDQPVKQIRIALDPSLEVVEAACRDQVDLLVTHHPLILKPLKSVDDLTSVGKIIRQAVSHDLSIFSAHTNLDAVSEGINDELAVRLGLINIQLLIPPMSGKEAGIGRLGDLEHPMTLSDFIRQIKRRLALGFIRAAGKKDLIVRRAAVCCGSGSSMMGAFFSSDAEAFISGDLKYHDARDTEAIGRALIDIGHFTSEHLFLEVLAQRLTQLSASLGLEVTITACRSEKDPFHLY